MVCAHAGSSPARMIGPERHRRVTFRLHTCLRWLLPALLACLPAHLSCADDAWQPRADWGAAFAAEGVHGTIAVVDGRDGNRLAFDTTRANHRFPCASTFKVAHALFALDAGVVRDEFQRLPWNGKQYDITAWNRDQDLRSSMRESVVWVYQGFARAIGTAREREYLQRIGYGNADASGAVDRFWLDGTLRISAVEQLAFLQRLQRNALPFAEAHQRLVKDIMVNSAGRDWILRAKTGWCDGADGPVGWWVGRVDRPAGALFFALNIDMPNGAADLPKRERIGRAILRSLGALPAVGADVSPR